MITFNRCSENNKSILNINNNSRKLGKAYKLLLVISITLTPATFFYKNVSHQHNKNYRFLLSDYIMSLSSSCHQLSVWHHKLVMHQPVHLIFSNIYTAANDQSNSHYMCQHTTYQSTYTLSVL